MVIPVNLTDTAGSVTLISGIAVGLRSTALPLLVVCGAIWISFHFSGLYGIGLAAGFVPWGALGGEKSFIGQANGLWLWQNDIGQMILDQLLEKSARQVA